MIRAVAGKVEAERVAGQVEIRGNNAANRGFVFRDVETLGEYRRRPVGLERGCAGIDDDSVGEQVVVTALAVDVVQHDAVRAAVRVVVEELRTRAAIIEELIPMVGRVARFRAVLEERIDRGVVRQEDGDRGRPTNRYVVNLVLKKSNREFDTFRHVTGRWIRDRADDVQIGPVR